MQSRESYRSFVILLILALVCVWTVMAELTNAAAFNFYCNDDAYISFTYARNFIQGRGLVFNPGEFVEGYTNFLWLMFLTPWMNWFPGIDVSRIAIFWGAVFSAMVLGLVYYLGYQERKHHWTNLIAPVLLSLDNSFHYWSISGLENSLQATLVLLGLCFLFRNAMLFSGLFLALATMARPDSGIFWCVAAVLLLLRALRSPALYSGKDSLRLSAGFLLILAPYCAWKLFYYGDVLPNTFYLHTGHRMARMENGAAYLMRFLENRFYLPLLFIASSFAGMTFRRAVMGMSVLAFCAYAVWIGGDFFPGSRFLYIVLPLIYLMIQDLVASLVERWKRASVAAGVLCLILGAAIFHGSYGMKGEYEAFVLTWAQDDQNRIQLARDLSRVAKPGDSILSGPVGQVAYYSGMKVLDYWGVTDPHIAKSSAKTLSGVPAHEKTDLDYLLQKKPTYVIFGVDQKDSPSGYSLKEIVVDERRWTILKRTDLE